VQEDAIVKGDRDPRNPQKPSVGQLEWHRGLASHGRVMGSAVDAMGTPAV
jgi:hypothetical protein